MDDDDVDYDAAAYEAAVAEHTAAERQRLILLEEQRVEDLRADVEWECMANMSPGRRAWKRRKLVRDEAEARAARAARFIEAIRENNAAHAEFTDIMRRSEAAESKNLDMLMQHEYGKRKDTDNECQVNVNEKDDPRPPVLCEDFELINFLDAEDIELNVAAIPEEQEFLDCTVEAAADSGAGEHVLNEEDAPMYAIEESAGSRAGQNFLTAGGHRMPNKGQVRLAMRADNGRKGRDIRTTFQVAKVTRPLMSVSKICDAGMSMRFTAAMAIVEDQAGKEVMRFQRQGGLYVAKMRLRNPNYKPKTQPFPRPGSS